MHFQNEDKLIRFSDFNPTKYNGTKIIIAIMEWLRYYVTDFNVTVTAPLSTFLSETRLDKDKFLTFVSEFEKSGRVETFKVKLEGDDVIFYDFRNTGGKTMFEDKI